MEEKLIQMLAEWQKIPIEEARRRFDGTMTARTLSDGKANLCFQTPDYIFSCLRQEIESEDLADNDFERPEEMPEGLFVRSH